MNQGTVPAGIREYIDDITDTLEDDAYSVYLEDLDSGWEVHSADEGYWGKEIYVKNSQYYIQRLIWLIEAILFSLEDEDEDIAKLYDDAVRVLLYMNQDEFLTLVANLGDIT